MIKPVAHHNNSLHLPQEVPFESSLRPGPPTLDDGQQDDNDEEEESDVEQDAVELIGVSRRVLQLISNSTSGSDAHVHVEHIALPRNEQHKLRSSDLQPLAHLLRWNCLY